MPMSSSTAAAKHDSTGGGGGIVGAPNNDIQSFASPYDANGNYTAARSAAPLAAAAASMATNCSGTADSNLIVKLDDRELWLRFQYLVNEMIVTKNGR